MKAARFSLVEYRVSDFQGLEFAGDIDPWLPLPLRGTSREQQIELPLVDEPHVSDADARVVRQRGWLPAALWVPDFQLSPAADGINL